MNKRADSSKTCAEMIVLLRAGKADALSEKVNEALASGATAEDVLNGALIPGMRALGEDFKCNRVYVPEVLIASRAMKAAMALLEPRLTGAAKARRGVLVIGAVAGDLHDIGKNLVATLARGAGFRVVDLGVDVPCDRFLEAVETEKAGIAALSCLLTTTLSAMADTVAALKEDGPAHLKVAIGGAPTTQRFADEIGADGYAENAGGAVEMFLKLIRKRVGRPGGSD